MNRPIKFRAWDGSRMLSGDRIVFTNRPEVTTSVTTFDLNGFFKHLEGKYVLMQSTGVFDLNGLEIFDGDVVKKVCNHVGYEHSLVCGSPLTVEWREDGVWDVDYEDGCVGWYFPNNPHGGRYEVIGNIYENSELIV